MSGQQSLYKELYKAFQEAFPKEKGFKGDKTQKQANDFWKENKKDENKIKMKILHLKQESFKWKQRNTIIAAFSKSLQSTKTKTQTNAEIIAEISSSQNLSPENISTLDLTNEEINAPEGIKDKRETPSQDKVESEVNKYTEEILKFEKIRELGLHSSEQNIGHKLKILHKKKSNALKKLKILKMSSERSRKYRIRKRKCLVEMNERHPEVFKKNKCTVRQSSGRPRIEDEKEDLLETIIEIATNGCAADDKRQSEIIRSCKSLNDLTNCLNEKGYNISRSATYLRLIPRRSDTNQGIRHIKTVPVELIRAINSKHSQHKDSHFAFATIKFLKELSVLLGNGAVSFLSQDDKVRVPLGLPAANKNLQY